MSALGKRERESDMPDGGIKLVKEEEPAPTFNPHTSQPYSQRFYDIYSKRRGASS
jgi:hypothetical protein